MIAGVSRSVTVPLLATLLAEAALPVACLVLLCCISCASQESGGIKPTKDCQASSVASSADLQLSYIIFHCVLDLRDAIVSPFEDQ